MLRTLKNILLPALAGLGLLALIGLLGSALVVYRQAYDIHPVLGYSTLFVLALALALFIVYPTVRFLRLPGTLKRPDETSGPKWEQFVLRYAKRLRRNPRLRLDYPGMAALEAALERAESEPAALEQEAARAIAYLDGLSRKVVAAHAAAVFTSTAISQSGRLDAAIVISAQLRMIKEIAEIYYQRPQPRELWRLYAQVGASTFLAGEIQDSEILAVLGAPVTAGIAGLVPFSGGDPLISLLVQSLLDGSANAFLTLRIGSITRRYCGLRLEGDARAIHRGASLEAAGNLARVVSQGAGRLASMTRRAIVENTARGTARAARGAARAGSGIFQKVFRMAEEAGAAAAESAGRGVRFLQESLRFWENVSSAMGRDEPVLTPPEGSGAPGAGPAG